MSLVITCLIAGALWFALGSRFSLSEESEQNDILNLAAYAGIILPLAFLFVFFVLDLK
ncbi:MAG: hypothetical protein OXF72_03285 [Gammaproteobacteria bacterium]|nr:hypothetical protein [Gammaproteobacteria bacterium]MCY4198823.1 hypothetical protein [Gammaproteobacteria bacterium]MCY4277160.1 hypothetical protein [Gammaproteobacteria bacterium]MCY4323342.1 hypothetical protein [Gammaproteobacteria bacterium]